MSSVDPYINMIIAMLGLAYPILLQVIARLDERYESENIATLFKTEWEWKAFRYTLIASLISILVWSMNLKPLVEITALNYIIKNSASLLLVLCTCLLVSSFFFFVKKVLIYFTPYSIIPYFIKIHEQQNCGNKYIPALSDLLQLTIRRQQTNLSRTISDFFYHAFKNVRDNSTEKAVEYPDSYYETVYRAIEELAILKEKRNFQLEYRTSGGIWLLGDMHQKEISERTYQWLWRNLGLAVRYQQDDLVVNHWKTCDQYCTYSLSYLQVEYGIVDGKFQALNQESVDKRIVHRKRFIEFHYALGGLLTYKTRYSCIRRLFDHTQSQPPRYELLPESMDEIFRFYFDLRDPYDRKYTWIHSEYPFPEVSGLNADTVVKNCIMSYMAILFLRQYTIIPYLITIRPFEFPTIPSNQGEIKQWIEGLDYFRNLVTKHLQNKELLEALNLEFITSKWCDENKKPHPFGFIDDFKTKLENTYRSNSFSLPISDEKVSQFETSTKEIIETAFEKLAPIDNPNRISDKKAEKRYVNGIRMYMGKDAFSEQPESDYLNFDSILAQEISTKLNAGLSSTFLQKETKSYLFSPEILFYAIDKLAVSGEYVVVNFGIDIEYYCEHLKITDLTTQKYKSIQIHSFNGSRIVPGSMFILKKSDLPNITTMPIEEDLIKKFSLKKISDSLNLYTSVIDLNTAALEVLAEVQQEKSDEEMKTCVLMSVFISTEFKWKEKVEIIRLTEYSEYLEQGVPNKLSDVKRLKKN